MKKAVVIWMLTHCTGIKMQAQPPAFYHLSTAEGLSDNNVITAARDQSGMLWAGTSEGLYSFDGNRITAFYRQQNPGLAANNIQWIEPDHLNRVWLRTPTHQISMLDEDRRFHLYNVGGPGDTRPVTDIFNTRSHGLIALKKGQHYILKNKTAAQFEPVNLFEPGVIPAGFAFMRSLPNDRALFYRRGEFTVVDYAARRLLLRIELTGICHAVHINDDELLAIALTGDRYYRISISRQKITAVYSNLTDQHGQPAGGDFRKIARIDEHRFIITTRFSGLYLLNLFTQKLEHWVHDPLDSRSIGGNNTFNISYDSSGYLLVTTQTSGLHYVNLMQQQPASIPYFINEKGQVFDGYIQDVALHGDSLVWLGAQDRLIRWSRRSGTATYIPLQLPGGENITGHETIRCVFADDDGTLWAGSTRYGVFILNRQLQTINYLPPAKGQKNRLPSGWINRIVKDAAGVYWIATQGGTVKAMPAQNGACNIQLVDSAAGWSVFFDKNGNTWLGTEAGAFCYNSSLHKTAVYGKQQGLEAQYIYAIEQDRFGSLYFCTDNGLYVLDSTGLICHYNRTNGLRNDRCEGILKDSNGYLWIGNLNCLLRFDPAAKTFAVFEEGNGFIHAGFRIRSAFKSRNGEMFWGTDKGLVWMNPALISNNSAALQPIVHTLKAGTDNYYFTSNGRVKFAWHSSSASFYFSTGELSGGKKSQVLCKLEGYDKEWRMPLTGGQVSYSKLPPGSYRFMIRASRDGQTWFNGQNTVTITIRRPWWQQLWFRLLCSAALLSFAWGLYRYRQRKKRQTAIKDTIAWFSASGYENATTDEILWDIARNCIAGLQFEDCVLYQADKERQVLVQKAAYGPKNPRASEIANPIQIPFGRGIVGTVAVTGRPLVVNDTSKDSRYIVDDERRYSEITVPVIHQGEVIAVIDSEHRKKRFFKKYHLEALQTIASICSAKISRAMAVDAVKRSEKQLMELNVKMAESKFLNLRLQMNPHFLFNALSSIQHLIVSQQTNKAYKYLTVFSNFLRSLLNHAEKNFIPLGEELKVLEMYVQLESLRFDASFTYSIDADEGLLFDEVLVPSLMVQPFAENAIWHGLLHKEGPKNLAIRFTGLADEFLTCIIEDNGIGREQSAVIGRNKISSQLHQSRGIAIIEERLQLLQQKTGKPAHVQITDLYDGGGLAAGTRVVISIPYYNPEAT